MKELPGLIAITEAATIAALAHRGQYRKDNITPYLVHPARVAALVSRFGGGHIEIVAAWLHDIGEDCAGFPLDEELGRCPLNDREREEISAILSALTEKKEIRPRLKKIIDSLERIRGTYPGATLVKICDRLDNLLDSDIFTDRFLEQYLKETDILIDYLSSVAKVNGYVDALALLSETRTAMERGKKR